MALVTLPADAVSVGLWDIGAGLVRLRRLIAHLNSAQTGLEFFHVVSPVPLGVRANLDRLRELGGGGEHAHKDPQDVRMNVVAGDLLPYVVRVREKFQLQYLIGIVPQPIFDDFDGVARPTWGLFSTGRKREGLVSADDELRDFARRAKHSIDVAATMNALTTLANMIQCKKFPADDLYHPETKGCVFDYCEQRRDIVQSLRDPKLCAKCKKIPFKSKFKKAFGAALKALAAFDRLDSGPIEAKKRGGVDGRR